MIDSYRIQPCSSRSSCSLLVKFRSLTGVLHTKSAKYAHLTENTRHHRLSHRTDAARSAGSSAIGMAGPVNRVEVRC